METLCVIVHDLVLAEVEDAPGQMALVAALDPVSQSLAHPRQALPADPIAQFTLAAFGLLQNAAVMRCELVRQILKSYLTQAQPKRLSTIKARRAQGLEMDPVEYGLQHALRAVIGLHGIGKDEFAAVFEDALYFLQHE